MHNSKLQCILHLNIKTTIGEQMRVTEIETRYEHPVVLLKRKAASIDAECELLEKLIHEHNDQTKIHYELTRALADCRSTSKMYHQFIAAHENIPDLHSIFSVQAV